VKRRLRRGKGERCILSLKGEKRMGLDVYILLTQMKKKRNLKFISCYFTQSKDKLEELHILLILARGLLSRLVIPNCCIGTGTQHLRKNFKSFTRPRIPRTNSLRATYPTLPSHSTSLCNSTQHKKDSLSPCEILRTNLRQIFFFHVEDTCCHKISAKGSLSSYILKNI
jgi:hypothetical protein